MKVFYEIVGYILVVFALLGRGLSPFYSACAWIFAILYIMLKVWTIN